MLFAGIDWSEKLLDFHLRTAESKVLPYVMLRITSVGMTECDTGSVG